MQVNSLSQQNNSINNANYYKANSAKNTKQGTKKNSVLDDLMKRKQNLIDYKNSLIDDSLKNNGDPKVLKSKTDEIDKQIEEIDKQIGKLQAEEQQKKLNQNKEKAKSTSDKTSKNASGESSTEINNENLTKQLNSIVKISDTMNKLKVLNKQKKLMSLEKNTLNSDIAIDEGRGKDTRAKRALVSKIDDGLDNIDKEVASNTKKLYTEFKKNSRTNSASKILSTTDQSSTVNDNSDSDSKSAVTAATDNTTKASKNSKHTKNSSRKSKEHVDAKA